MQFVASWEVGQRYRVAVGNEGLDDTTRHTAVIPAVGVVTQDILRAVPQAEPNRSAGSGWSPCSLADLADGMHLHQPSWSLTDRTRLGGLTMPCTGPHEVWNKRCHASEPGL